MIITLAMTVVCVVIVSYLIFSDMKKNTIKAIKEISEMSQEAMKLNGELNYLQGYRDAKENKPPKYME